MKHKILLNLFFVALFVVFLVLSFVVDFFFFIPIICFLPFSFKSNKFRKSSSKNIESKPITNQDLQISTCPKCGGKIALNGVKFCYHCGVKLKDN
ncbi:MAG: hypothetical protein ACFFB0_10420 [Promethearchaeota archaeon]